ncbi:hypothetical protein [Criblamydia sequanensis]|uniref:Uncharacterized protein n=1 Tax=Candidatus Criblamydia sequanensis CRIB-18 TaxID=1437425 RepID=A0A090D2X9_9BACT|nr:hypothetical protein [Criblamydia sequanensis]CDR34728.1 hypothetical protein CSEC_1921 [Criblamydia sequanensis CRIB-18]
MEAPFNYPRATETSFENLTLFEIDKGQENLEGSEDHPLTYETANALATSLFENTNQPEIDELLRECQQLRAASDIELKTYLSLSDYETNFFIIIQNREYSKAAELITFLRKELPGFDEAALIQQFVSELRKHVKELNEKGAVKSELLLTINWESWEYLDPLLLPFAEYFQYLDCIINKKAVTAELSEKYKSHAYFLFRNLQKRILNSDFNGIQNKIELFLESYSEAREDPFKLNYFSTKKLIGLKIISVHRTKSSFTEEEIANLEKEYFTLFNSNVRYPLLCYHYLSFLIEHDLIEKLLSLFKEKKIPKELLGNIFNILNYHEKWDVFLTLHNDYRSELVEYNPSHLYQFYYLLNIAHQKLNNNVPFDLSSLDSPTLKLLAEAAVSAHAKDYTSMQKIEKRLFSLAQAHHNFEVFAHEFRCVRLMALGKFEIAFDELEKRHLSGKIVSPKNFVILGMLSQAPLNRYLWASTKLPPMSFIYRILFAFLEFSKTRKETRMNLELLDKLFYTDEPYDFGTSVVYLNVLTYIGNILNTDEYQELRFETSQKALALARTLLVKHPSSCEIYIPIVCNYLANYPDHIQDIIEEGLYSVSDKITFINKCLVVLCKYEDPRNFSNISIRICIFKLVLAAYCFKPMPKQAYDLIEKYSKTALAFLSLPYQFNLSTKTIDLTASQSYKWNHVEYFLTLATLVGRELIKNNFKEGILLLPKKFPTELPSELQRTLSHLNYCAESHLESKVKVITAMINPLHQIAALEHLPFFTNFRTPSVQLLSIKISAQIFLKQFDHARRSLIRLRHPTTLSTYHLISGNLFYEEGNFTKATHHYDRIGKNKSNLSEPAFLRIVYSKLRSCPNDPTIPEDLLTIILKNNFCYPAYKWLFKFLSLNKNTQIDALLKDLPRTHEFYFSLIEFYFLEGKYEEVVRNVLEFESGKSTPGKEHYDFFIGEFYYKSLVKLDKVNETLEQRKESGLEEPKGLDLFFFLHYWLNLENGTNATKIKNLYIQKNPKANQNEALMGLFRIVAAKCYFYEGDIIKATLALQNFSNAWSPQFIFMISLLSSDFNKAASLQSKYPIVDPKKSIITFWKFFCDPFSFSTLKDPLGLVDSYKKMMLSEPLMDTIEHHYLFISFLIKLKPNHPQLWECIKDYVHRSPRTKQPKEAYFLVKVLECINIWQPEDGLKVGFFFLEKCPKKKLIFEYIVNTIKTLQKSQISFSLDPYIKTILTYRQGFPEENFSQKSAERRLDSIKGLGALGSTTTVHDQKILPKNDNLAAIQNPTITRNNSTPVYLDLTKEYADPKLFSNAINPITISTSSFMNEMEKNTACKPSFAKPFISKTHLTGPRAIINAPIEPVHPSASLIPSDQSLLQPAPLISQTKTQASHAEPFSLYADESLPLSPIEPIPPSASLIPSDQSLLQPAPLISQTTTQASHAERLSLYADESLPLSPIKSQPMEITPNETNEEPLDFQDKIFKTPAVGTSVTNSAVIDENNFEDSGLETLGSELIAELKECIENVSEIPDDGIFHDQEAYPNLEFIDSLSESDKELAGLLEIHSYKHLLKVAGEEGCFLPCSRIELYRFYESLSTQGKACLLDTLNMACKEFNKWLESDHISFIRLSLKMQNGVFAFSYHSKPISQILYAIVLKLSKTKIEENNSIIESTFFYFISHILRVTNISDGYHGEYYKNLIQKLNPKLWSLIEIAGKMNASRFPLKEKLLSPLIAITYKNLLKQLLSHFTSNIESFFSDESFDSSVIHSRGIDVSFIFKLKKPEGIFTYYSCFLFDSNGFPLTTFSPSKLDFKRLSNYSLPVPYQGRGRFERGDLAMLSNHLIKGSLSPRILFIFSKKSTLTCSKNVDKGLCSPYIENFASNIGQTTSEIASLLYSAESCSEWEFTNLHLKNYRERPPKDTMEVSIKRKTQSTSTIEKVSYTALSEKSETASKRPIKAKLLKTSNNSEHTHKRKADALKKSASLQKGKEKETVNLLSIEEGVLEFKKLFNSLEKNNLVSFEKVRDISYLLWEYLENQMASNLPIVFYPKSSESEDALLLELLIYPIEGKKMRILYRTEPAKCLEAADYFKDVILAKKLEHFESTFAGIEKQIRHNFHESARKKCITLNYILSVILDQAHMKSAKTRFERKFVDKVREISQKISSISRKHGFKLYSISDVNDLSMQERKEFLSQFNKPFKFFLLTSSEDLVSSTDPKVPLFVSNIENHVLYADTKDDSMAIFNANDCSFNKQKILYLQSVTRLGVDFLIDLLLKNAYFTSLTPLAKDFPKILNEMRQKVSLSIKQIELSPSEETKNQAYQCLKQWFFLQFEFISKMRSSFFDFKKESPSFVNLIISLKIEEITKETICNLIKNFLSEQKVSNAAGIAFLEEIKKDSNFDQEFQSLLEAYIEPKPIEGPRFPGRWVLKEEEKFKTPLHMESPQNNRLNESKVRSNNADFDAYCERNLERSSRKKAAGYAEIAELEPSKRTKKQSTLFERETEKEAPIFPLSGFFPTWSQNDFQSSSEGLNNPVFYQKNLEIFNTEEYLRLTEQALQAKKEKYKYLLEERAKNNGTNSQNQFKKEESDPAQRLELIYNNLKDIADEIYYLTNTVREVEFSLHYLKADLSLFNLNFNLLKFKSHLQNGSLNIDVLKPLKDVIINIINECFFHLSNQHSWLKKNNCKGPSISRDRSSSPYSNLQVSHKKQKKDFRESIMDSFSIFPTILAYDASNRSSLNPTYYLPFIDILTDSLMQHFKKLTELKEQKAKCEESDPKKILLIDQVETLTAICLGNFKELDFYLGFWKIHHKNDPEKLKQIQIYFDKAQNVMKALFTV